MSSLGSPSTFFLAKKKAYEIERSLRFNDNDTAYLNKTFGSGGNRKKWTFSAWIKRGNLGGSAGEMRIFGGNANASHIRWDTSDTIYWDNASEGSGSVNSRLRTTQKFRDSGAWFHLVCALDTDNSTADSRMRMYMNGIEITDFGTRTNPSSGYSSNAINAASEHAIGYRTSGQGSAGMEFDGYMAEINFIDGQQYDASYFGETNPITGQWNPKKYVGGYGTTGFYLPLTDNSGTTATTLGKDSSGNGNNWTPNNFVTGDAVKDSPTNNFSTLMHNSTPVASGAGLSEGNLEWTTGTGTTNNGNRQCINTISPTTGKWYAEVMFTDDAAYIFIGVHPYQVELVGTSEITRWQGVLSANGDNYYSIDSDSYSNASYAAAYAKYDVIGIYMDMDASPPQVYYSKNGQWADGSGAWNQSSPSGAISLGGSFFTQKTGGFEGISILIKGSNSTASPAGQVNFGQDSTFSGQISAGGNTDANGIGDFKYSVPTGAKAICSANLPDPTILLPNKHFDTLLYTGNNSTNAITGLEYRPDWVWIKNRSTAVNHYIVDSLRRSATYYKYLNSNETNAEGDATRFTSIDSNGFTLPSGGSFTNANGDSYVAWNWNAGDTDGKTYTVTVVDDSGNKYRFDGYGTSAVTLDLAESGTYIFNYPSAHPFRFSETSDGTHGGGSEYTTGVTVLSSTSIQIVVAASAPNLNYYCSSHSGMGGQVNTNSTLGSSNFDGAIQSTAKVNASAGFSIATWTSDGNSSPSSFGHGLGVKPDFLIIKSRGGSGNWQCWSQHFTNATNDFISLNLTDAKQTAGSAMWGTIDSTVVNFRHSANSSNGNTMIGYFFSEVASYSKFGTFSGNGNSDGTFIYLGFSAALIIYKNISSSQDWLMVDPKRIHDGNYLDYLEPNTSDAEGAVALEILSNGFKLRESGTKFNGSGNTFIYLAWAESPFKNARAR